MINLKTIENIPSASASIKGKSSKPSFLSGVGIKVSHWLRNRHEIISEGATAVDAIVSPLAQVVTGANGASLIGNASVASYPMQALAAYENMQDLKIMQPTQEEVQSGNKQEQNAIYDTQRASYRNEMGKNVFMSVLKLGLMGWAAKEWVETGIEMAKGSETVAYAAASTDFWSTAASVGGTALGTAIEGGFLAYSEFSRAQLALRAENLNTSLGLSPLAAYFDDHMSDEQLMLMEHLGAFVRDQHDENTCKATQNVRANAWATTCTAAGALVSPVLSPAALAVGAGIGAVPRLALSIGRHKDKKEQKLLDQANLKRLDDIYEQIKSAEGEKLSQLVDEAEQIKYRWIQEHPTALIHELLPHMVAKPGASEEEKKSSEHLATFVENCLSAKRSDIFKKAEKEFNNYHHLSEKEKVAQERMMHYMLKTTYDKNHVLKDVPQEIVEKYTAKKTEVTQKRMAYERLSCHLQREILNTIIVPILTSKETEEKMGLATELAKEVGPRAIQNCLSNLWSSMIEPQIDEILANIPEDSIPSDATFRQMLKKQKEVEFEEKQSVAMQKQQLAKKATSMESTVAEFHRMTP